MSILLGILIAGLALTLTLAVSWIRWRARDRRIRRERLAARRRFDERERQLTTLRGTDSGRLPGSRRGVGGVA